MKILLKYIQACVCIYIYKKNYTQCTYIYYVHTNFYIYIVKHYVKNVCIYLPFKSKQFEYIL